MAFDNKVMIARINEKISQLLIVLTNKAPMYMETLVRWITLICCKMYFECFSWWVKWAWICCVTIEWAKLVSAIIYFHIVMAITNHFTMTSSTIAYTCQCRIATGTGQVKAKKIQTYSLEEIRILCNGYYNINVYLSKCYSIF